MSLMPQETGGGGWGPSSDGRDDWAIVAADTGGEEHGGVPRMSHKDPGVHCHSDSGALRSEPLEVCHYTS